MDAVGSQLERRVRPVGGEMRWTTRRAYKNRLAGGILANTQVGDNCVQIAAEADRETAALEAKVLRFARALADYMDGEKDHDIEANTGLSQAECDVIAEVRKDAVALVYGPNVRAKRATTAGRQARAGDNVQRTACPGLVACRWRSA